MRHSRTLGSARLRLADSADHRVRSIDPCAIRKTLGDRAAAAGAHLQPVSMIGLEELANTT
ncbi:hypothetical protein XCR_3188 [Xanthomonas campestris pv. raphani 756C]|nr:hypothetical protein XCR_3188 [Xanthomonas campestris pv. raphani 756C]